MRYWYFFIFLGTCLGSGDGHGADDLYQYLEYRDFQVIREIPAQVTGSLQFERYLVKEPADRFGVLTLGSNAKIVLEAALHEFHEALGIAHVARRPILVRRKYNGIPSQEVAMRIFPREVVAWNVQNEGWYPALIEPFLFEKVQMDHPLVAQRLYNFMKIMIAHFALGASSHQELNFAGEMIHYRVFSLFEDLLNSDRYQVFKKMMVSFPYQQLQAMDSADAWDFTIRISAFLNRLEGITWESFSDVFDPAFRVLSEADRKNSMSNKALVLGNIPKIRGVVERYLRERIGGPFREVDLKVLARWARPLILPRKLKIDINIPVPSVAKAIDARETKDLVDLYFRATLREKRNLLAFWETEFPRRCLGKIAAREP